MLRLLCPRQTIAPLYKGTITCAWCRMTKQFLKDNDIEYEYIDVDLCQEEDKQKVRDHIRSKGVQALWNKGTINSPERGFSVDSGLHCFKSNSVCCADYYSDCG